ncbi:eukaryotic translation initiation factor 4G-like [Magnolia sinica]|uniref:eukaryotic translation initiation factor 4G-like n=1 Tax=Magnolia sinica TaxID=86752 RepID=UPI0026586105|nr:eukaryotic translation initiation factor 4G-like [Magnolia sinica]
MSLNQSRAEKSEAQVRKPGRSGSSNNQRSSSGGAGKGGSGTAPPPSPSISSSPSLSTNKGFKKSGNGQGGQSRVGPASTNSEPNAAVAANRAVQNGTHVQSHVHGVSDVPVSVTAKPIESSVPRSSRSLPKAPSSQTTSGASDSAVPATPSKGDAPRAFPLQFGTISPGFMNGMQIPARTSSAPPNLDEQKRDQARHNSVRGVPTMPIPPVLKQQQMRKDVGSMNQSNTASSHPQPQAKRDIHIPIPAAPAATAQKSSVLPMTGMSMPMPFQQPQVPIQFGGPTQQIQSQGVTAPSLQMLPVGNAAQVQQQVFVPSLQSHPLQPQGMMHQGQSLGFAPQMGHQMVPQLGNLGIGMPPQFAQQQAGKFGAPRKAVKITHPETHEELKLDNKRTDSHLDVGSSGPRSHPNVPPQSQPIPSFPPAHSINYYPIPNSYNSAPIFFQPSSSLPLTGSQMTPSSSASRYNYSVGQGGQAISFMNPLPVSKAGPPMQGMSEPMNVERTHDGHVMVSAPTASVQVTVKPPVVPLAAKAGISSVAVNPSTVKGEPSKLLRSPGEAIAHHQQREIEMGSENNFQQPKSVSENPETIPLPATVKSSAAASPAVSMHIPPSSTESVPVAPAEESTSVASNAEGRRKESIRRSDSFKDQHKKPSKKEPRHSQQQHQADISDSAGGLKTSSLKLPKDSISSDLNGQQLSRNPENVQAPSEALRSPATASTSSVGQPETEEGKAIPSMSETSGVVVDTATEVSQDVHLTGGVQIGEGGSCEPENLPDHEEHVATSEDLDASHHTKQDITLLEKQEIPGTEEQRKTKITDGSEQDLSSFEVHTGSAVSESTEDSNQMEVVSQQSAAICNVEETNAVDEPTCAETEQMNTIAEEVGCSSEIDRTTDNLITSSTATSSGSIDADPTSSHHISSMDAQEDKSSAADASKIKSEIRTPDQETSEKVSGLSCQETAPAMLSDSSESAQKLEGRSAYNMSSGPVSTSLSASKDRISLEQNRAKGALAAGKKKKRKEFLLKADAAGTSSDLYMAYKGPEEKPETAITPEIVDNTSDVKQVSADATEKDLLATEDDAQSKAEIDDWEDVVEISSPKLKTLENGEQLDGAGKHDDEYGSGVSGKKKYSKDFLLTLSEQYTDLPLGFEIGSDIIDAIMSGPVANPHLVERESYPSSGRIIDRPSGGSRPDRRGSSIVDDDKWSKAPGPFASGRDPRLDVGHGGAVINFRPGQGGNHGVLRNPRGQPSGQYGSGILSGPIQSLASPGGMPRNSPDADRWQRATGIHKGLIPSPQTPLQVMHKAEKKYEVGKVSDQEEVKQRQLKGILNKLTPQNFEKLFQQVKEVNIDNAVTLTGVISQIFDKALTEPTFCEMYANFCLHLAGELPDFSEDNEKITFKRLLLNKCQEEFERGEREQAEANRAEEEGEIKQSKEEREEKKVKARRRMLGNIRLIGELYKKRMLTERIMHECIKKLLGQYQNHDEEDVEALCKLMSTIGEMIDHPKAKEHMDAYFDMMLNLSNNQNLSSRVRFMLRDAIDLRKNKWQQRRKVEGPKKIEEVHRDAAQERQLQVNRSSRGPSITSSARRGQPIDYGPRSSTVFSPSSQQGGIRNLPPPLRGGYISAQDARLEDRHPFESRTLSVPLPQRSTDDDSITLGPQGGLARGMSIRGQPLMSSVPLADSSPSTSDPRRMASGPNGYSSASDWTPYYSREELTPRYIPDRFAATPAHDQSNSQDRTISFGNRDFRNADRPFDSSMATSPVAGRVQGPSTGAHTVSSEPGLSEDRLRDMSIAAIREFYSARNEEEVRLCIKDLKSPDFYPDMVMLWVTDSFDRKNDVDRDLLAKLLVNLSKSRDSLLSQVQLVRGFESVLSMLEDAVTDSPKAAEYLGRIIGQVVAENVIPLKEIGRLIHEGGEESGCLLQSGLASDVLVSILEIIRREKGDKVLNEIRVSSNLRLEDFQPPDPIKTKKLDAFI